MSRVWPAPYLQPDRHTGCYQYSLAYLARCLGHPNVSAETLSGFRTQTGHSEACYLNEVLGQQMEIFWQTHARVFWLGGEARSWVEQHFAEGWIGLAAIDRGGPLHHSVAVLEARESGVLLMDPLFGFKEETWDWFLGVGPGHRFTHQLTAWYR